MNSRNKFHSLFFALLLCCLFHPADISAQFYSLRTNLVGLSTGNLNLEGSIALSTRWSAHLPLQYNPFELWDNAKLKNLTVAPGVRYWLRETYGRGCFFGLHGLFSYFNAGGSSATVTAIRARHGAGGSPSGWHARSRGAGTSSSSWAAASYGPTGSASVACTADAGWARTAACACCPRARPSTLSTCSVTLFFT